MKIMTRYLCEKQHVLEISSEYIDSIVIFALYIQLQKNIEYQKKLQYMLYFRFSDVVKDSNESTRVESEKKIKFCFRYPLCFSKNLKNDEVSLVIWIYSLFSERPAAGADFFFHENPAGESPKKLQISPDIPPPCFLQNLKTRGGYLQ